ncbi:MAG TPA: hypothetical protein VEC36_11440 [Patescibacteria group bacterium]|nr:hypothetical protein [Patescibacteria group bacterium]
MYSPFYLYFILRSDSKFSQSKSIIAIEEILSKFPEIELKESLIYQNSKGFPWINITLLNVQPSGNWHFDNTIQYANCLSITALKHVATGTESFESKLHKYEELLKNIARALEWELINEDDEL